LLGGTNGNRILFNLGGGVISISSSNSIGVPSGANYPDKFNFTDNATLQTTNNFTLGRQVSGADNAGFRIGGGKTATFDVLANSTLTLDGAIIDIPSTGSGKLTKISAGRLALNASNTYSGNTTVSAGTLALTGSGSIANSPTITIAAGAAFDVSLLSSTFSLGSSQTLSNSTSTAVLGGNAGTGLGTVSLTYASGTPSLVVTNGTLTLSGSTTFKINNTGSALAGGSYKIIATNSAGFVAGTLPTVTINGGGTVSGTTNFLKLLNNELYLVVNHPPVATNLTVTRTAGLPLKIALSNLTNQWSDLDGDPITLAGINLTTTNGVNLTTNSSFILYPNSANVADQISYTVSDSFGTTAAGLINVVMNPFVSGQDATVTVSGSTATVNFAGIPGYNYGVQRSTNLTDWATILTTNAPSGGVFNCTDDFTDLGTVPASAFYRLRWQP
jgi:autotransporter-associated beta strand protein